jgi:hypothetical protein
MFVTHLCQKEQNESREILKNQLIQKAQQYFTILRAFLKLIEIQKIHMLLARWVMKGP